MTLRTAAFGDIAAFRNGLNYSRDNFGVGLKVISVAAFGDRRVPDYASLGEINPEGVATVDDFLEHGDLLFVRSNGNRDLVGRVLYLESPPGDIGFSGFCIRARVQRELANPEFCAYYFRSSAAREALARGGTGASIQSINQGALRSVAIPLPSREHQDQIVGILSAYDELIDNNQRRIKLLEEAARRLYREWFVALRFPGHERVKVVDGIPQGWERRLLSDNASYLNRGISPAYDDRAQGLVINQKCIRNGLLNLTPARRQAREVPGEKRLQTGDVLINSTGTGTLGRVAQVRSPLSDCTVDTHVTIFRPTDQAALAFWGLTCLEMEPRFSEMGVGATNQQELLRAHVGSIDVLVPPVELQIDFHERTWGVLLQSDTLSRQSDMLRQARDALLPRLVSGALAV